MKLFVILLTLCSLFGCDIKQPESIGEVKTLKNTTSADEYLAKAKSARIVTHSMCYTQLAIAEYLKEIAIELQRDNK
jgi:hypothetical protein